MAPEVFKGDRYGANVDTYALGVVLYTFLNQNRAPFLPPFPHPIKPQDREEALQRRMSGEPIPSLKLENASLAIESRLNALVLKACAYDRRDRFSDPTALRKALEVLATAEGYETSSALIPTRPKRDRDNLRDGQRSNDIVQTIALLDSPQGDDATDLSYLSKQPDGTDLPDSLAQPDSTTQHPHASLDQHVPPDLHTHSHTTTPSPVLSGHKKAVILASAALLMLLAILSAAFFLSLGRTNIADIGAVTAYGISVDSQIIVVLADREDAQAVLKELEDHYSALCASQGYSVTSVTFEETIDIVGMEQNEEVIRKEEALQALIDNQVISVLVEGTYEVTEEINFQTETKKDDSLEVGSTEVRQAGKNGTKILIYTYTARNGVVIEEKTVKINETMIEEPVEEIIAQGNKPSPTNPHPVSTTFSGMYSLQNPTTGYLIDANTDTMVNIIYPHMASFQGTSLFRFSFSLVYFGDSRYHIKYHPNYGEYYFNQYGSGGNGAAITSWYAPEIWYLYNIGDENYVISSNSTLKADQSLVITTDSTAVNAGITMRPYSAANKLQWWKFNKVD